MTAEQATPPLPAAPAALLEVRNLRRSFNGVHAVNGASMTAAYGQITGLIGPNGAGKSTALSMMAGAVAPDAGQIVFEDRDITGLAPHERARLGMIRTFQLGGEFARLTVMENLLVAAPAQRGDDLWGALRGRRFWRAEEESQVQFARTLLERFELTAKEDDYAGELSGGQRRLVEIMRALMSRPKLLLLDEPMAGVNRGLARLIEAHLMELRDEGLTMVLVEHEMGCVERVCNRVVVMAQGVVISEGDMSDIRTRREVLDAYLTG